MNLELFFLVFRLMITILLHNSTDQRVEYLIVYSTWVQEQYALNIGVQIVDMLTNSCKDLESVRKQARLLLFLYHTHKH
jgi:hypothetical protein